LEVRLPKEEVMEKSMRKIIVQITIVTALVLLVPFVAMQFSEEVDWDLFDFVAIGALVFGAGLAYRLLVRNESSSVKKIVIGIALVVVFLLIWINGAVDFLSSG
jgi:peptidoglycan/LPS O-acetylase OafA/YrhL